MGLTWQNPGRESITGIEALFTVSRGVVALSLARYSDLGGQHLRSRPLSTCTALTVATPRSDSVSSLQNAPSAASVSSMMIAWWIDQSVCLRQATNTSVARNLGGSGRTAQTRPLPNAIIDSRSVAKSAVCEPTACVPRKPMRHCGSTSSKDGSLAFEAARCSTTLTDLVRSADTMSSDAWHAWTMCTPNSKTVIARRA